MTEVSAADYAYYNGGIRQIDTESSVLISSSRYLNDDALRALVAQEMLRRNGPDMPTSTAYIPQVAQILLELEDLPTVTRLFEEEKERLPEFRRWLREKKLSNFRVEEVKHCAPGTLGFAIHDFLSNSGYQLDHFFQGMEVDTDYSFYLKERAYTHDIEHMITGFETNNASEIALMEANMRAFYAYFRPELAAVFNRMVCYLRARSMMRSGLHYPESFKMELDATDAGAAQGRNWKMPLMLVPYRDMIDRPIAEIRLEYGITPLLQPGCWDWTTAISEDPRYGTDHTKAAAE